LEPGGTGMVHRLPNALSVTSLKGIWASCRDKAASTAGGPGIDRITAAVFASRLDQEIRSIRASIQQDQYQFRSLRPAIVPKKDGSNRIIAVPIVRDRLLQRAILKHLESDSRFSGTSKIAYGFRKGRTLQEAQKKALELRQSYHWVAQADIIKFFDNIDRNILIKIIEKSVRSQCIRKLISLAIRCELDEENPKAISIATESGVVRGKGLRQGMPLSPLLSNLLLKDFDNHLISKGLVAIRYADDIAIFAKDKASCTEAILVVQEGLKALNLKIPHLAESTKTTIRSPTEEVEFLGIDIRHFKEGYKLCVPKKRELKIENYLKEYCSAEYLEANKITLIKALFHIDSFLTGHSRSLMNASDHHSFLEQNLTLKRKYTRNLLISIFGREFFRSMSDSKKAVLGIQDFS
jgi:RNA-directed DNA polymerase